MFGKIINMKNTCLSFLLMMIASVCCITEMYAQADTRAAAFAAKRQFIAETVLDKPFHEFKIKNGRQKFTNESLKGKVVFLNFWFENCPPCRAEFRTLNWLYKTYKDNPDFEFISVTFENSMTMKRVKNDFELTFPMYYLPDANCADIIYESGYPTNIILDKEGIVRYFNSGGPANEGQALKYIQMKARPVIDKYLQ